MALSDGEVISIVDAEIRNSNYGHNSSASADRRFALDRYLGKPYGDEVEGRSQIVTREVLETVEFIKPSLMRIICDADNLVEFDPVGTEDEQAAEQESDVVSHIFWKMNDGYLNILEFITDCLISKIGIFKVTKQDPKPEREEYDYLSDWELAQLLTDPQYEREPVEYERQESEKGVTHNVVFETKSRMPVIKIEVIPPEEYGVREDANTIMAHKLDFQFHRSQKTYADLLDMGIPRDVIDELPHDDVEFAQDRNARFDTEIAYSDALTQSRYRYWITEAYIRLDRNEDGIVEMLQVIGAGDAEGMSKEISIEEVDSAPFCTATPIVIPHRHEGLSEVDLVADIQRIKTVINRQLLDNAYQVNNSGKGVSNKVNIDDLLTNRPGMIARVNVDTPDVQGHIVPLQSARMPAELFQMLEYEDNVLKARTGVADEVGTLDKNTLANINTGVMAMFYDAARAKIELLARNIAELGIKTLFHKVHELARKCPDASLRVKLKGEYVQVDPSSWRSRTDSTLQIGMGRASRERRIMFYDALHEKYASIFEAGGLGTLVTPEHIYNGLKGWAKAWGEDETLFFQDPSQLPPQPEEPSAQDDLMRAQAQALMMDGQSKLERNKIEMAKAQLQARETQQKMAFEARNSETKRQIEELKGRLAADKAQLEYEGKVASIDGERRKQATESALQAMQMRLDAMNQSRDREIDIYKIKLENLVKLLTVNGVPVEHDADREAREARESEAAQAQAIEKQAEQADREAQRATIAQLQQEKAQSLALQNELFQSVQTLHGKLDEMEQAKRMPQAIEYDERGLLAAVGGRRVERDPTGRALRIA